MRMAIKESYVLKSYPAGCVHEYVIERVIIDLHSNNSYRGFLGSFSNHDGMSSRNRGRLLSNVKRDRVNKGVTVNLVVVHCPLVPGFIRSFVVDISKVSKRINWNVSLLIYTNYNLQIMPIWQDINIMKRFLRLLYILIFRLPPSTLLSSLFVLFLK